MAYSETLEFNAYSEFDSIRFDLTWVKRPGKNHSMLFKMLRDLHGPPEVRREFIGGVIRKVRKASENSKTCLGYLKENTIHFPCRPSKGP